MLDKETYLDAFHHDAQTIAAVARRGLDAPLPSCPEWTMAGLLGHLGAIYTSIAKNIRVGEGEDVVNELEDLELPPDIHRWFEQGRTAEAAPASTVDWFQAGAAALEEVFRESDPAGRTWTWLPADQSVGFWVRRMTHETAVHRWDAQLARGEPDAIPAALATDGVDEALTVYQPRWCRPESSLPGNGESFHFHQTDGDGEWVVRFEGKGMEVSREHAKADVAARGPASDLLLFLWHRIPASRLDVRGDVEMLERYFELAPPD